MSKEETVEVTTRVPKNVMAALREFVLKHDNVTEQEYFEREVIRTIVAEIEFFCWHERIDDGDPKPTLKRYGLLEHYQEY